MKNPEERPAEQAHQGASGGQSGNNEPRNPSRNGKRKPRHKTVPAIGNAQNAAGSERPSTQNETEEKTSGSHRKRARRRRRGKSGRKDAVSVLLTPVEETASQENKTTGKISNRRRRARKKKQARLQNDATPQIAENTVKNKHETPHHDHDRPANQPSHTKRRQGISHPHHHYDETPLYAALDLGTNNCRLLIASPTRPGQFRVVDAFSRIVRLGEGLSASGRLSEQAMQRAIDALGICRDKLAGKKVRRARLIATEACRSASNGEEFLARVHEETGLNLEIVDRQTEARLAVSGCGTLVARDTDAVVLFDIGGGSSEIALIDVSQRRSPRLAEHITAWTSLPVGVVTLAEKFGGRNVTPTSFEAMVTHVTELLSGFAERHCLGELVASPRFHLLGTSGTVTTLAGIHLGLERYDRRRVDGMWMGSEDVTEMTSQLLSWDFDTRVANPCIGADRADLVLAGCAILDAIRKVWPSEKLLVADRGLREGILTELMSRDGAWRNNRASGARNRQQA